MTILVTVIATMRATPKRARTREKLQRKRERKTVQIAEVKECKIGYRGNHIFEAYRLINNVLRRNDAHMILVHIYHKKKKNAIKERIHVMSFAKKRERERES